MKLTDEWQLYFPGEKYRKTFLDLPAVIPSPPAIATPTVEEKSPLAQQVVVQPAARPTASVAVAIPSIGDRPTKAQLGRQAFYNATKEHPWINSLGMKFLPVADTQVLFSVWEKRVQDFEEFVADTNYDATGGMWSEGKDGWKKRGAIWWKPSFTQGPTHPVVGVSWNDAKKFCEWLTGREQGSGALPRGQVYRLPTDAEWSAGAGLQGEEGDTPGRKEWQDQALSMGQGMAAAEGRRELCRRGVKNRRRVLPLAGDQRVQRRLSADESRGKFCGKRERVV